MDESHRKTKRTFNEPGHAHFLTFSCYQRLPLLTKDRTRQWVLDALNVARRRHDMSLWAYVVMPEHLHVLVYPRQDQYSMERFLSDVKRPVAWRAKQHLLERQESDWLARLTVNKGRRQVFRFWQAGGGFDRNVVHDRGIRAVIDYIHGNPVRRGLVTKPTDWLWSSARYWQGIRPVPIEMDALSID